MTDFGTKQEQWKQKLHGMYYVDDSSVHFCNPFDGRALLKRFVSDREVARKQNDVKNDSDEVFLYVPKNVVDIINQNWDEEKLVAVWNELKQWNMISKLDGEEQKDTIASFSSRIMIGFPGLSLEHTIVASKWFAFAFTDELMEMLMRRKEESIANAFVKNTYIIFSGSFNKDLDKLTSFDDCIDGVDDEGSKEEYRKPFNDIMDASIDVESMLKSFFPAARHVELCKAMRDFIQAVIDEKTHFSSKNGFYFHEDVWKKTRKSSNGYIYSGLSTITNENYCYNLHTLESHPLVESLSWICALDNDIGGSARDRGLNWSPTSKTNQLIQDDKVSYVSALKLVVEEANDLRFQVNELIQKEKDEKVKKHLFTLLIFIVKLNDFHYNSGLEDANLRYGWIPKFG